MKELYLHCMTTVDKLLVQISKPGVSQVRLKKLALEFQKALITLSFFEMGTQRRQIITYFSVDNIIYDEDNDYWAVYPPHEKTPRQGGEGISMMTYFGEFLDYFKNKIRPLLEPHENVKSLWVNEKGGCNGT